LMRRFSQPRMIREAVGKIATPRLFFSHEDDVNDVSQGLSCEAGICGTSAGDAGTGATGSGAAA